MSERNVVESEVDRGAMRKMGYDQSIGCTTMFVYNNEVGDIVGPTGFCKFFYNIIPSIDAMRVRKDKSQLLEHYQGKRIYRSKRTLALENCSSLELGSRDVVIIIFGSCIPAREYSLSICVVGSIDAFNELSGFEILDHT